jgi:hypothetical protein
MMDIRTFLLHKKPAPGRQTLVFRPALQLVMQTGRGPRLPAAS